MSKICAPLSTCSKATARALPRTFPPGNQLEKLRRTRDVATLADVDEVGLVRANRERPEFRRASNTARRSELPVVGSPWIAAPIFFDVLRRVAAAAAHNIDQPGSQPTRGASAPIDSGDLGEARSRSAHREGPRSGTTMIGMSAISDSLCRCGRISFGPSEQLRPTAASGKVHRTEFHMASTS